MADKILNLNVGEHLLNGKEDFLIESTMTSIVFPYRENKMRINLVGADLKCTMLNFYGVDRLRSTGIATENIIDRISLWDSNSNFESYRNELAWLLTGNYDEIIAHEYRSLFEQLIQKIKSKSLILLQIEPVSGIEIILLCSLVTWAVKGGLGEV